MNDYSNPRLKNFKLEHVSALSVETYSCSSPSGEEVVWEEKSWINRAVPAPAMGFREGRNPLRNAWRRLQLIAAVLEDESSSSTVKIVGHPSHIEEYRIHAMLRELVGAERAHQFSKEARWAFFWAHSFFYLKEEKRERLPHFNYYWGEQFRARNMGPEMRIRASRAARKGRELEARKIAGPKGRLP
jgi:hypothetical protein